MSTDQSSVREGLLATILSEESYRPVEPDSLEETGLTVSLVESLLCKRLQMVGMSSGRKLAEFIALPFRILEPIFQTKTKDLQFFPKKLPIMPFDADSQASSVPSFVG